MQLRYLFKYYLNERATAARLWHLKKNTHPNLKINDALDLISL